MKLGNPIRVSVCGKGERKWAIQKNSVRYERLATRDEIIAACEFAESAHNPVFRENPYLPTALLEAIAPDRANRRLRVF
jgi:hypothetical protein